MVPKQDKEIIQDDLVDNKDEVCEFINSEATASNETTTKHKNEKKQNNELKKAQKQIEEKDEQIIELKDRLARIAADFENHRKRTIKELENRSIDAKADLLKNILPVLDNFDRALSASGAVDGIDGANLKQGVEMIYNQLVTFMTSQGVEEIQAIGCKFDPELHNAVMHIEDESIGENEIAEVFAKGYKYKDKVLRYSMVKVAN